MKKLIVLLIVFFNIMPCIKQSKIHIQICATAAAQNYSSEGSEDDPYTSPNGNNQGVDSPPQDPDEGIDKLPGEPVWDRDHPCDEDDPDNDPDEGYLDWADWMDYLYDLEEIQANPYASENVWGEQNQPRNPTERPYYYITSSSDNHRRNYATGSQITVLAKANSNVQLKFKWNDAAITANDVKWEKDGNLLCPYTSACNYSITTPGTFIVAVRGPRDELVNVKLLVIDKSIVNFHKKDGYNGDYGFDEDGYQYPTLVPFSNYQTADISGYTYNVPWMSVLDGQEEANNGVIVQIEPLISNADANNSSFRVSFVPSNPRILVDGLDRLEMDYPTLMSKGTIKIYSTELDADMDNHTQESIEVFNQLGQIIGKINISCQKPQKRKVVLIYVKNKAAVPYRNDPASTNKYDKDFFISRLNEHSHNQIFKNWEVVITNPVTGLPFPTTLDLTTEYTANPTSTDFLNETNNPSSIPIAMNRHYKDKLGVDWIAINNGLNWPDRTFFHFVTNFPNSRWGGTVDEVGGGLGCVLEGGLYITGVHELGHNLRLAHTFWNDTDPLKPFGPDIPKFSTDNIMDYAYQKLFFYYQWIKSY